MAQTFANLEGLMRLSQREGVDIRPSLLRVLTDLYVQNDSHTREEEQQYLELAMRLLPSVDQATRTAVAMKLAVYPRAPGVLLEQLAAEIARSKTEASQSSQMTNVRIAVASVTYASVSPAPLRPIRGDGKMPTGEQFLRATGRERREMLRALAADDTPEASPIAPESEECLARLECAALELRPRDFAADLQLALGLSQRIALQIVQDDDGEPLLVAAKALGMHIDRLLRILLFLNPTIGQSVERVFSLYRFYEEIGVGAAEAIVASWREGASARSAAHQPVHAADSERRESALLHGARRGPDVAPAAAPAAEGERARG